MKREKVEEHVPSSAAVGKGGRHTAKPSPKKALAGVGSFRLYDFSTQVFLGPVETRAQAEKRKSKITRGRRDTMTNWYRFRVAAVMVRADGTTITAPYRKTIRDWRWYRAL